MLVVMKAQATPEEIQAVCEHIEQLGFRAHPLPGAQRTAIGITGNPGEIDRGNFEDLSGVADVIRVSKPYKLASRDVKEEDTIIRFAGTDATIGGRSLAIVAGPCSIESREQAFAIAEQVAAAGAQFFRGGAYKPRTSPYAFQGLGVEALKIMSEIRERFGLRIITEAIDNETLGLVAEWADVIQIGARNMQNFSLLKHAGRLRKPVLLKRGMSATLDEFLMAAEYIMSEGNYEVILCERGVRTFADHTRNTLDLSIVPAVQKLSHLPILVDPSHGTGKRDKVLPMARAAVAVGADGVLVEVHHQPDKALSDGPQSIYPDQFERMMHEIGRSRRWWSAPFPAEFTWNASRLECMAEPSRTLGTDSDVNQKRVRQASSLRRMRPGRDFVCIRGPAFSSRFPACRRHDFPQYPPNYREYAYVTNGASNTVTILDVVNVRLDRELQVGTNPLAVAPSPTRNEVYVLSSGTATSGGSVAVIGGQEFRYGADPGEPAARVDRCGRRRQAGVCGEFRFQHGLSDRPGSAAPDRPDWHRGRAHGGADYARRQDAGCGESPR